MVYLRSSVPHAKTDLSLARTKALDWSRMHRLTSIGPLYSVIIPAYNEAERIRPTIESVFDHFSSRPHDRLELIVVDDGSTDNTREVVQSFGNNRYLSITPERPNIGKGFSVKQGMLASTANRALFMDADGSTPISEFDKLENAFESGFDVAIGSRSAKGAEIKLHQPLHREMMGRTFNFFVKWLSGLNFEDTQCGFKAFTRHAAADVFIRQKLDGFAFDVEALYLANKLGYKIAEVPIIWTDSPKSKVNTLTDPIRMFADTARVRWMHIGERRGQ